MQKQVDPAELGAEPVAAPAPKIEKRLIKNVGEVPEVNRYFARVGATIRSPRKAAVVRDRTEFADNYERVSKLTIRIDNDGEVHAPEGLEPDEAERVAIAEAMKLVPGFEVEGRPFRWRRNDDRRPTVKGPRCNDPDR